MEEVQKDLNEAIKAKDYDKSLELFTKYQELDSTSDKDANDYYSQLEALKDAPEQEEKAPVNLLTLNVDQLKELANSLDVKYSPRSKEKGLIKALVNKTPEDKVCFVVVEVEPKTTEATAAGVTTVQSAPRVENRGKKPKSIGRKDIETKFNDLLVSAVNYQAQVKTELNTDSRFALKLVRRLSLLKKQLLR